MGPQVRKGGEILPLSPLVSATAFMGGGPKPTKAPLILPAYFWRHGPFHANWRACTDQKRTPYWLPVLLPAVQHPLPSKPLNSLQLCSKKANRTQQHSTARKPRPMPSSSTSSWLLAPSLLLRLHCCSIYNLAVLSS